MHVIGHLVRATGGALACALVVAACSTAGTTASTTTAPPLVPLAGAVAATVGAAVADFGDPENPAPVIIAPLVEGTVLPLEVQAEVVSLSGPTMTVQFIDDPALALVDDGSSVVDGSLLFLITVLETQVSAAIVGGEYWRSANDVVAFRSVVEADGDTWRAELETRPA